MVFRQALTILAALFAGRVFRYTRLIRKAGSEGSWL